MKAQAPIFNNYERYYYTSLDEIYVDYINKYINYNNLLDYNIDMISSSKQLEKETLSKYIVVLGNYIEELLKLVGGRICFKLTVFYVCDFEEGLVYFQN